MFPKKKKVYKNSNLFKWVNVRIYAKYLKEIGKPDDNTII